MLSIKISRFDKKNRKKTPNIFQKSLKKKKKSFKIFLWKKNFKLMKKI